jgi:predicted small metal-binding protein
LLLLANYDCCGLKYVNGKTLTDHMRSDHNVAQFAVSLSCCGTQFEESRQLSEHMKKDHGINLVLET